MESLSDPNLNNRRIWKISKHILDEKSERTIPPLLENDNLVSEDDKKADIFNIYFASIASLDHSEPLPKLPDFQFKKDARIQNIQTSKLNVQRLQLQLNIQKSTGPDAIGNWVQNITKTQKNDNFQMKKRYFSMFWSKHRLWVHVRTASVRWF